MRMVETLKRIFRPDETRATRSETFTSNEQLILNIFSQSKYATDSEVARLAFDFLIRSGKSSQPRTILRLLDLVGSLEKRGYLEIFEPPSEPFGLRYGYYRVTNSGKSAIRQIRKQQNAFRQTLTVDVPSESQK